MMTMTEEICAILTFKPLISL